MSKVVDYSDREMSVDDVCRYLLGCDGSRKGFEISYSEYKELESHYNSNYKQVFIYPGNSRVNIQ